MSRILFATKHIWRTLRMSTPLFVGSYLQVTWWALGQWKGRKFYLSDNHHYFSSVDIKICTTKRFTWWKQVRFGWQLERISCVLCWSLQLLLLSFFCLKSQVKECSLDFILKNCSEQFLSAYFLFRDILNLHLTFAVNVNLNLSVAVGQWPGKTRV